MEKSLRKGGKPRMDPQKVSKATPRKPLFFCSCCRERSRKGDPRNDEDLSP
jgi:hypothetical protein